MFFDFLGEFVELGSEVFLFAQDLVVLFGKLIELDVQFEDAVFECLVFGLIIFPAHFMFFELSQKRLEFIAFHSKFFKGIFHLIVGVFELKNFLLVLIGLFVDFLDFALMVFDKFEVVPGDLVVVVFEFVEGLLVVFHQLVDVQVFALF